MCQFNADTADFLSDIENENEIARQEIQLAEMLERLDRKGEPTADELREYWSGNIEVEECIAHAETGIPEKFPRGIFPTLADIAEWERENPANEDWEPEGYNPG